MSNSLPEINRSYATVAHAIEYIRANSRRQPSLAEIADEVNLSEFHMQRVFTEWAGISPKRVIQYLTKERAKQALKESRDLLSATLETGLSSPGRLHDLMITCEAMTPGEIKAQGHGVTVKFGITSTPFGSALIGWTTRGICYLAFCENNCDEKHDELSAQWPAARLMQDDNGASNLSDTIFPAEPKAGKLHLLLRGTNFQIKVWEALLNIESSQVVSYSTLAELYGSPKAQRTIGSAVAANRIAYLIPCHRVIRESVDVGVYQWGSNRKLAMQAWEAARYDTSEEP